MNEPNPAVKQSHIDSALTQLNTQRHALEVQLEAVVAGIIALEQRLFNLSRSQDKPADLVGAVLPDRPTTPAEPPADDPGTPTRIVAPGAPDNPNIAPCNDTTDGNHVANQAGICTHCGSQVTTPIPDPNA
jgi:hypothetical protein